MDVFVTDWALQSYLELKQKRVFSDDEYHNKLRPDAEKIKNYPTDAKFTKNIGWGPAKEKGGANVLHGFKLKWKQIGSGRVQLRVGVAILAGEAYLCRGYVKNSDAIDKMEIARLKIHINRIVNANFKKIGKL